MNCPNCNYPLDGGLFICPDCNAQGEQLLLQYHLSGIAPGLPKPKRFHRVVAPYRPYWEVTYKLHDYQAHRQAIRQYQQTASVTPSRNEATVRLKDDLDPRVLEAIQHGTIDSPELPF